MNCEFLKTNSATIPYDYWLSREARASSIDEYRPPGRQMGTQWMDSFRLDAQQLFSDVGADAVSGEQSNNKLKSITRDSNENYVRLNEAIDKTLDIFATSTGIRVIVHRFVFDKAHAHCMVHATQTAPQCDMRASHNCLVERYGISQLWESSCMEDGKRTCSAEQDRAQETSPHSLNPVWVKWNLGVDVASRIAIHITF